MCLYILGCWFDVVWGGLGWFGGGLGWFFGGILMDHRRKHCVVSWSKALSDFIHSTQETSQYD